MLALFERFGFYFLFIVTIILSIFLKLDLSTNADYKYLFSSFISIISIALGFLTTILSQLKSYNNFELTKFFKREGYYNILKLYYWETITSSIISVILSMFLGIYFCSYEYVLYTKILSAIYAAINVSCLYSYIKVTFFYLKITNIAENEINLKENGIAKKDAPSTFHFHRSDD